MLPLHLRRLRGEVLHLQRVDGRVHLRLQDLLRRERRPGFIPRPAPLDPKDSVAGGVARGVATPGVGTRPEERLPRQTVLAVVVGRDELRGLAAIALGRLTVIVHVNNAVVLVVLPIASSREGLPVAVAARPGGRDERGGGVVPHSRARAAGRAAVVE